MLQRRSGMREGGLFGLYLILQGAERFLIEFIRLNPLYWGLSQAQWVSLGMIGMGAIILWLRATKSQAAMSVR